MSRFEYKDWNKDTTHEVASEIETEEVTKELASTESEIKKFMTINPFSSEFHQRALEKAQKDVDREVNIHSGYTEIQKKVRLYKGIGRIHVRPTSTEYSVNPSYAGAMAEAISSLYVRREELTVLLGSYMEIDELQAQTDSALLAFNRVLERGVFNYWARRQISTVGSKTGDPQVDITLEPWRVLYNGEQQYRGSCVITVTPAYHDVMSNNLQIVPANGKQGFPLTVETLALPKGTDPDFKLFKARVAILSPSFYDHTDQSKIKSFVVLEDRYICETTTTSGERIVSCSTTEGRAIGGVNVKTKNKVMDELTFSF